MFCPNCGTQIPEGSAFCENCGIALKNNPASVASFSTPSSPPKTSPQNAQPYFTEPPSKKKGGFWKIVIVCALIAVGVGVGKTIWEEIEYENDREIYERYGVDAPPTANGNGTVETQVDTKAYENWLLGDDTSGTSSTSSSGGKGSASSYATDALPKEADFDWFYDRTNGTINARVPDGATIITDASQLSGGWKCFVMRQPNTEKRREYWNINLSMNGSSVACTQYWSGAVEDGVFVDYSAANSNPLSGTIDRNGVLELEDEYDSEFTILQWYSYNGKQYGIGTYECGWDEEDALGRAAVCRP